MLVTALWCVLLGGSLLLEAVARWTSGEGPASRFARRLCAWAVGRLGLVLVWGFVGWHLFARYTL